MPPPEERPIDWSRLLWLATIATAIVLGLYYVALLLVVVLGVLETARV